VHVFGYMGKNADAPLSVQGLNYLALECRFSFVYVGVCPQRHSRTNMQSNQLLKVRCQIWNSKELQNVQSGFYPLCRAIHKSLQDLRPLRYSSLDGHTEGEHVNKGRDIPSFWLALQVLNMSTLGDISGTWLKFLAHAWQFRTMALAGLFVSQRTGSHSAGISCTTNELFCP
jgi:hypothetical protein